MTIVAAWSWTSYQDKKSLDNYLFQHWSDIAVVGADNSKGTHCSLKKYYSKHELSLHILSGGGNIGKVEEKFFEALLVSVDPELNWLHWFCCSDYNLTPMVKQQS